MAKSVVVDVTPIKKEGKRVVDEDPVEGRIEGIILILSIPMNLHVGDFVKIDSPGGSNWGMSQFRIKKVLEKGKKYEVVPDLKFF